MPDPANIAQAALGRRVDLPGFFTGPVTVEEAEPEGDVVFLRVRTAAGTLDEVPIPSDVLEQALATGDGAGAKLVPAQDLFLLAEAARIRLAYAFDPYFAVSLSGIDALPHQLEAVYERMLPQTRLRFLLAHDPGAGKTIMAGLLIKELKLRGVLDRVLIVCPAPLTIQWQDELSSKFEETFEIVNSELARNTLAGNVWERFPQAITSLDFLKQPDIRDRVAQRWGASVLDENGEVVRKRLGTIVFADENERRALEAMVFPYIERRLQEEIAAAQADPQVPFVVLDAAIMLEAGWNRMCDRIVYVHVPRTIRLQRLAEQRGWTEKEVAARERAQMPLSEKISRADFVLDNSGPPEETAAQVADLLRRWGLTR